MKFKTNINCGNCVRAVTPGLNKEIRIVSWSVDLDNEDKVLSVEGSITPDEVVDLIKTIGFKAEKI